MFPNHHLFLGPTFFPIVKRKKKISKKEHNVPTADHLIVLGKYIFIHFFHLAVKRLKDKTTPALLSVFWRVEIKPTETRKKDLGQK